MKLAWNILKASDDGLPNLNFDHRTLVIRETLINAARDVKRFKPPVDRYQILIRSNSF